MSAFTVEVDNLSSLVQTDLDPLVTDFTDMATAVGNVHVDSAAAFGKVSPGAQGIAGGYDELMKSVLKSTRLLEEAMAAMSAAMHFTISEYQSVESALSA